MRGAWESEVVTNCDHLARLKFSRTLPYAFTEHGALMAANVLNSPEAVKMSVYVVRAFIKQREILDCCVANPWKGILAFMIGNPYLEGIGCLPKKNYQLPRFKVSRIPPLGSSRAPCQRSTRCPYRLA